MSNAKRNQQMEFEEVVRRFMEGAADWESRGLVRPETGPRVRGVSTRGAIPTRGIAVRTRGGVMPAAKPSTLAELVEEVKPQLSKASLIFILDGAYNEAASRFCEALAKIVGKDKEPAAWWIKPDGQESPHWPWSDVVELKWSKECDRRIAEGLGPDLVFVSASPQGTQLQRVERWRSAKSIVVERSFEAIAKALEGLGKMPPIYVFADGELRSIEEIVQG